MKKLLPLALLLVSCISKEGLTSESNKPPTGNPSSSIVVEEFADLQCPACQGAFGQVVEPLLEKYGNVIRYEFKHFPIRQIHPFAQEAAEAAECAADQGVFWDFVDHIYESRESQAKLSREDHIERAQGVGVSDLDLFERCMKSRIKRDVVQAEFKEGNDRGVRGTPTFFVNGVRAERNNVDVIGTMIDEKLGQQRL